MIMKTKISTGENIAERVAKYIERGLDKNKVYKELYYEYRPMKDEDMKEFIKFSERAMEQPAIRHLIIAPEKRIEEKEFHYLVMKTLREWRIESRNYGIRFLWGLHYNTEHPHAHIEIVSPYWEEMIMERTDIRKFNEILEEVFKEKMKTKKGVIEELWKELQDAEKYEVKDA